MKKIKVFRIIARLNIGGPAIQSILLTNALNTDRFESILVSGIVEKGESQMDFLLNKYNVKPIFIPELRREVNPISDFIAFCKICRLIIREKPDIIHTHTSKAGVIGRLAAFLLRVPVKVHTFHGHTFYGYFNRYKSRIFLNIERMLSKITDLIIAISPRQAKDIEKYKIANKPKCKIIWLGLDLDMCFAINPEAKEKERVGFKNDEIIVGTVGRITGIKNHRFFLEVAQKFCLSQPQHNVKFVIVGDGELRKEIENYRDQLGLTNRVRITGWQEDIVKFYSAFDIFLLTSKNEGTPVSVIEAMASGLPVISTNVGGVSDLLGVPGKVGYLVDNFDKEEFVERLNLLVKGRDLRDSIGRGARDKIRSMKLGKDTLIKTLEDFYEKLLKDKKG